MVICSRRVSNLDLIADMRYAEKTNFDGKQRSTVPRLPLTRQVEEFYTDLLEMMCIRLGESGAPGILTEASGDVKRIELYYGDTGCTETKKVLSEVALNEYGYCVKDNKIFIYGHTMEELKKASERFLRTVRKSIIYGEDNSRTFDIADDAGEKMVGEPLAIMKAPAPDFGENALFCDDGISGERMWVVSGCSVSDYKKYLTMLEDFGFCEYETNEITGNRYATYIKEDIIVDAWYTKDGYVRISAGEGYDLRSLKAKPYERICEPAMYMLGATEKTGGGECIVFRLSDGRFVIIDSSIPYEYGDNIFALLKSQAPDPEHIVVANWLITHDHGDHVCGMVGMCRNAEKNRSVLTIESFSYNFPGFEQASVPWQGLGKGKGFHDMVSAAFPNAKTYRLLPGNTFDFADMHIEVLASHESYIYDKYPNNTNACNLFCRVTMCGQVIILSGDTSDFDHSKLIELYGDYLQCDILKAPHHGGLGSGTVEASKKYSPKFILYTCPLGGGEEGYGWLDLKDNEYNQQLIDPSKNTNYQEHFIQRINIYCLPLPYSKGQYIRYTWNDFGL